MGEEQKSTKTIGISKYSFFGETLRAAIKAEFGTSRVFASCLGVSPGRVSQILNDTDVAIGPATIEAVVNCFEDLGTQEMVRQAWLQTFAPSELEETGDCELRACQLLASLPTLIRSGKARETIRTVEDLRKQVSDSETRFCLTKASIDLSLFRGNAHYALRRSQQLIDNAVARNEQRWVAIGLWTKATAGRVTPGLPIKELVRLHDQAVEFVGAWTPHSFQDRTTRASIRESVSRDRALTALAVHERQPLKSDQLNAVLKPLDCFLEQTLKPDTRAVFFEVKGRVHLAQGDLWGCGEALDEARSIADPVSPDFPLKVAILQAKLLIARGQRPAAEQSLEEALERCFAIDALHHAQVIEQLLTDFA